jgi:type IV secretory pathway TrbL component
MGLTGRLARTLGVDGNPLRRASDRAEAWLRAGLLVLFLSAGPIAALTAAQWTTHATGTATTVQPHAVRAAQPSTTTTPAGGTVAVRGARWEDASGSGQVTGRQQRDGSAFAGVLAAVLALTFTAFALLIALRLIQWLIDRRRLAGWEAAWRATGPRWTGRRS